MTSLGRRIFRLRVWLFGTPGHRTHWYHSVAEQTLQAYGPGYTADLLTRSRRLKANKVRDIATLKATIASHASRGWDVAHLERAMKVIEHE